MWHKPSRSPARALLGVALLLWLALPAQAQGDAAERLGIYHWWGRVPAQAGPPADELAPALRDLERFGAGTARIFVGGRYDYLHTWMSPQRFADLDGRVTLANILALPRYRRVLEHPQLKTVWLTAYPVLDHGDGPDEVDLRRRVSGAEWKQHARELREMVEWLYRNFGDRDKTILITNYEADEKLRGILNSGLDPRQALDNLRRDLRLRFDAVQSARRRFPRARLSVLCGIEISLWRLRLRRTASGTYENGTQGLNVLEQALPRLRYDFISFSAWEVLGEPDVGRALREALDDIGRRTGRGVSSEGRRQFGQRHVLVGEFGYAREWNFSAPRREEFFSAVGNAVREGRAPYAVYWQLYDNMQPGRATQYGLVDPEGNLTDAGRELQRLLRGPPAAHSTPIATTLDWTPPMLSARGTALPAGASAGTCTATR